VQFSPELRDDVASGDITVSIRLWSRPKVKVGGRYDIGPVRIEVDSIGSRYAGERRMPGPSTTTHSCTASNSTSSHKHPPVFDDVTER
jgi:hypothetical protein